MEMWKIAQLIQLRTQDKKQPAVFNNIAERENAWRRTLKLLRNQATDVGIIKY
jgi:hypothetical protein